MTLLCDGSAVGARLDSYLAAALGISRSQAARLTEEGAA